MKRLSAIILSVVIALSVCACGGGSKIAETTTTAEETTVEETVAEAEDAFLTSTVWQSLYQGTKLVFNEDKTLTFGVNEGTWQLEGEKVVIKYDTQYGTIERDFDIIHEDNIALKGQKMGKSDGKATTFSGTSVFYSEDDIDKVRDSVIKKLGDTVNTDIIEFTLNNATLGYSAVGAKTSTDGKRTTTNPEEALMPPMGDEYAFFSSSKGRVLACMDFTIKNTDRNKLDTSDHIYSFMVLQNEKGSLVKGYDLNNKDGDPFGNLSLQYSPIKVNDGEFRTNDASNKLLDAGSSYEIKLVGVVGFEPEDLTSPFDLVVQLKNSNDETESFLYRVE